MPLIFLRVNHVPYMTKSLRKPIMRRTEIESKYLRNKAIENKTECKNLYSNLEVNQLTDNKLFGKTTKLVLSGKTIQSFSITFVNKENNQIISDDLELAATFSSYFEKVVANLGIKEYENNVTHNTNSVSKDGVDLAITKYKDSAIIKQKIENVFFKSRFSFKDKSETDM